MFHNTLACLLPSNRLRAFVIISGAVLGGHSVRAAEHPDLSATVINGASVYTPAELFPVYRDQLGRPINSASAQAIVAQIEAMYVRDGYVRPEFGLQSELIGAGILRIEVFEARVTDVVIQGNAGPYVQKLESLSEELRRHAPLKSTDIQNALQKMRELPGLEIRASTRRDELRRNSYTLIVDASFKRVDATLQLTNRGTDQIGPEFVLGQLVGNNLLGWQERLGVLFSAASDYHEYRGGGVFADVPVGDRDAHLSATTFMSRSDPSETPDRGDVYTRDRTSLRWIRPVTLGSGGFKLAFSAGVDIDNLSIERGTQQLRDERLRVLEIGSRVATRSGSATQYLAAMQIRQGLDGFGSQLEAADLRYDPRREDFQLLRLQYTQLTRFAQRWTVRFDALGQHSAYVLPDAERYKIGGERLGRGFEVAEIAGDQGIGAKLELRRELSGAAAPFGRTSVYGFYDIGAAWKQDQPGRESAATSGLGLALEYGHFGGYLEVAKPLTHADVEGNRDTKVFAELNVRL